MIKKKLQHSLLKKLNIRIDFCYIDGSHYYEGIKNDYNNFNSILKKDESYEGCICGDDYELDLDKINSRNEADSLLAIKVPDQIIRSFLLQNLVRKKNKNYEYTKCIK